MDRLRVQEAVRVHLGLLKQCFLVGASHLARLGCLWRHLETIFKRSEVLVDSVVSHCDVDGAAIIQPVLW